MQPPPVASRGVEMQSRPLTVRNNTMKTKLPDYCELEYDVDENTFELVFYSEENSYRSEIYGVGDDETPEQAAVAVCHLFGWDKHNPAEPENDAPDVPGIDDCDYLYSLSSRSGDSSVYIRVHETSPGEYHAALTVDSSNFCEDLPGESGPFKLPGHACAANLEHAREWFKDNRLAYVYCNDSRRVARKYPHGLAR